MDWTEREGITDLQFILDELLEGDEQLVAWREKGRMVIGIGPRQFSTSFDGSGMDVTSVKSGETTSYNTEEDLK
jgi:hypothetical protein